MVDDLGPILQRLEDRLVDRIDCMEDKLDKVRTEDIPSIRIEVAREIATLKTEAKSSGKVWGIITSAIGSVALAIVYLVVTLVK